MISVIAAIGFCDTRADLASSVRGRGWWYRFYIFEI
jgi:hypothetical protein